MDNHFKWTFRLNKNIENFYAVPVMQVSSKSPNPIDCAVIS